jgi:hypothetical protein
MRVEMLGLARQVRKGDFTLKILQIVLLEDFRVDKHLAGYSLRQAKLERLEG